MELEKAELINLEEIHLLVQKTIMAVYPKYYATGVVDFFCAHHSVENIKNDISGEKVFCVRSDGKICATGTVDENHITRVFVLPEFQGKGIGSFIFDELEKKVSGHFSSVELDSSLAACRMYEKRGYKTVRHEITDCMNGSILAYEVMQKIL